MALSGLARFKSQGFESDAIAALADESNRVKKTAFGILSEPGIYFDRESVFKLLENGSNSTQKFALRLLSGIGGLEALYYLLLGGIRYPEQRKLVESLIDNWLKKYGTRLYFSPNPALRAEVVHLLEEASGKFDQSSRVQFSKIIQLLSP